MSYKFAPSTDCPYVRKRGNVLNVLTASGGAGVVSVGNKFMFGTMYSTYATRVPTRRKLGSELRTTFTRAGLRGCGMARRSKGVDVCTGKMSTRTDAPTFKIGTTNIVFSYLTGTKFRSSFMRFCGSRVNATYSKSKVNLGYTSRFKRLAFYGKVIGARSNIVSTAVSVEFPMACSMRSVIGVYRKGLRSRGKHVRVRAAAGPLFFPGRSPLMRTLCGTCASMAKSARGGPLMVNNKACTGSLGGVVTFKPRGPNMSCHVRNTSRCALISRIRRTIRICVRTVGGLLTVWSRRFV